MSRIGKIPVAITGGAKVSVTGRMIKVEGKQGTLTFEHRPEVSVKVEGNEVTVERVDDSRRAKAMHGTTRAIVQNMIVGATEGFKKELEINGVGWTAQVKGRQIDLNIGYADVRTVAIPMGVDVEVKGPRITVTGSDKQLVGQCAAAIRAHRKPEPYNHKGIKYVGEVLIKKEGKAFAGGGG